MQEQEQEVKDINYHVQEPFNTIFDRESLKDIDTDKMESSRILIETTTHSNHVSK